MAIVHYPGEIKNFKTASAAGGCIQREGIILQTSGTTDPRVTVTTGSGDRPFGVADFDTYNQDATILNSGAQIGVIQEGEAKVAVVQGTYYVGDAIYVSDDDGHGTNLVTGSMVGVCTEYRAVATGDVTGKTNQVRCQMMLPMGWLSKGG